MQNELIVAGCAKNIVHHKQPFVPLLHALQALGSTSLIVYEDGSTDSTRASLLDFARAYGQGGPPKASESSVRLLLADDVRGFFAGEAHRERRIALCRHCLLREALDQSRESGSLGSGGAVT